MTVQKNIGDVVSVTATIRNTSNVDYAFSSDVSLNNTIVQTKSISILAGNTEQVSFSFIVNQSGTFDIRVRVLDNNTVLDSEILPRVLIVLAAVVINAEIVSIDVV